MLRRRMFEHIHPLEKSKALHLDIIYVAWTSVAFCGLNGGNPICIPYSALSYSPVNGTWFSGLGISLQTTKKTYTAIAHVHHHKERDTVKIRSSMSSRCSRNSPPRGWKVDSAYSGL